MDLRSVSGLVSPLTVPAGSSLASAHDSQATLRFLSDNGAMATHRVLVVDDEANIAELVATALRYEGFDVHTAADGAGALAAVRDLAPDLVVLDVMLPDADGFELQARIRRDGQHVPVLFL